MNELEFKLNASTNSGNEPVGGTRNNNNNNITNNGELFEFKLLQHSTYLTLNAYMIQRAALMKASSTNESEYVESLVRYCESMLNTFFQQQQQQQQQTIALSRPRVGKEEKFILVFNKLLELFLTAIYSSRSTIEHKIGELVVRLATLLIYYGEDSLSSQVNSKIDFHFL